MRILRSLLWYIGCVPLLLLSAVVSAVCLLIVGVGVGVLYVLFAVAWHVWMAMDWLADVTAKPSIDKLGGQP